MNFYTYMKFTLPLLLLLLSFSANAQDAPSEGTMTREQKNSMMVCPVHNKHMELSENYRANASDYTTAETYPFAYQLNYRRYCNACTKAMEKEQLEFERQQKASADKETLSRCALHGEFLKTNPEFSSVNSVKDKDREKDIINARQYKGSLYCKTCSKVYEIRNKKKE